MKKIFLNKFFLVSSGVLLFAYGVIYACGGGDDWGMGYSSNFTPETFSIRSKRKTFLR